MRRAARPSGIELPILVLALMFGIVPAPNAEGYGGPVAILGGALAVGGAWRCRARFRRPPDHEKIRES